MLHLIAAVSHRDGDCHPSHAQTSFLAHCRFVEGSHALGIHVVPLPTKPLGSHGQGHEQK